MMNRYLFNRHKLLEAIEYHYNKFMLHKDMIHLNKLKNLSVHEDTNYIHQWDKSDFHNIKREYNLIRSGKVLPNNLINILNNLYEDKTAYYTNSHLKIENKNVIRKRDKITDAIIRHWARMHVGKNFETIQYICIGTDNSVTPTSNDTDLVNEVARGHILDSGGHLDAIGKTEFYGLLFAPADVATNNIGESGLATTDDATTDILATRTIYSPKLVHTVDDDGIGINTTIEHKGF